VTQHGPTSESGKGSPPSGTQTGGGIYPITEDRDRDGLVEHKAPEYGGSDSERRGHGLEHEVV
jgi:hypothetical protein